MDNIVNKLFSIIVGYKFVIAYFKLLKYGHTASKQREKLKILMAKACNSARPKTSTLEDFKKMPFITKSILKEKSKQLISTRLKDPRIKKDSTSGSTGEKTIFFTDAKFLYYRHACADYGDTFSGWKLGEPRLIIWGAERDIKQSFLKKIINSKYLFNTKIVSSYHMTENDMNSYIDLINSFSPTLIIGYPSTLDYFSTYIKTTNRLKHSPNAIITGGETLYETQRKNVQSTFRCKVLNRYGCREVGIIASECLEQNGMHVHSSHVIVEVVSENGSLCKPGELGEIVVTDLDNHVSPFIRYRIGDIGILSDKKCKCGRDTPMLQSVEGRTFDLILGTNGNRVPGNFFTLLRNKVKGINKFQVIQREYGEIILKLVVSSEFTDFEKSNLFEKLKEKLGDDIIINLEVVAEIDTTQTGKYRYVISEINMFNHNSITS